MADSTLGLALIGCGRMGLRHLRGLAELQRAQLSPFDLVAVCDARPEAAERAAALAMELLGRRPATYSSIDALLADPAGRSVDAVDLVTDVGAHHSLGVPVLQQGKHLLCEKPLAHSLESAARIAAAEARHPGRLSVCYQLRYASQYQRLIWLIRNGWIGEVQSASVQRHGYIPHSLVGKRSWWGAWNIAGGGVLMTQVIKKTPLSAKDQPGTGESRRKVAGRG